MGYHADEWPCRFTVEEEESGKWPYPTWFVWDNHSYEIALDGRMFQSEEDAVEAAELLNTP